MSNVSNNTSVTQDSDITSIITTTNIATNISEENQFYIDTHNDNDIDNLTFHKVSNTAQKTVHTAFGSVTIVQVHRDVPLSNTQNTVMRTFKTPIIYNVYPVREEIRECAGPPASSYILS